MTKRQVERTFLEVGFHHLKQPCDRTGHLLAENLEVTFNETSFEVHALTGGRTEVWFSQAYRKADKFLPLRLKIAARRIKL